MSSEILKVSSIKITGQESAIVNPFKNEEEALRTTARSNERRVVELVPLPVDDDEEFEDELDETHLQIIRVQDGVGEDVEDGVDPYEE